MAQNHGGANDASRHRNSQVRAGQKDLREDAHRDFLSSEVRDVPHIHTARGDIRRREVKLRDTASRMIPWMKSRGRSRLSERHRRSTEYSDRTEPRARLGVTGWHCHKTTTAEQSSRSRLARSPPRPRSLVPTVPPSRAHRRHRRPNERPLPAHPQDPRPLHPDLHVGRRPPPARPQREPAQGREGRQLDGGSLRSGRVREHQRRVGQPQG